MAIFNNSNWTGNIIAYGSAPNDNQGDPIRNAFIKVDDQFQYLNGFLGQTSIDFPNANVTYQFNVATANVTNAYLTNVTGTTATFAGNISAGNVTAINYSTANYLVANTQLYVGGNTIVSGNIVPSANLIYNLGSPSQRFNTLYVQATNSSTQINESTTAGILEIHSTPGPSPSDVGILGNITQSGQANTYSYFGYELSSGDFVYKLTNNDPTLGNNIVINSTYGGAQFGNLVLSNATPSANTVSGALVVTGGAGIGGNLNIGSNLFVSGNTNVSSLYVNGYAVITTQTTGINLYSGGNIFNFQTLVTNSVPSTSTITGALVVQNGGVGVGGNIFAGGLNGPVYGDQSSMASVTTGSVTAGSVSGTNGYFTSISVGTITGLSSLSTTANITLGNLTVGQVNASTLQGTMITGAQPNITSLGTVVATNFSTANVRITGGNVTVNNAVASVANIGNLSTANAQITGGTITGLVTVSATNVYGTVATVSQPNITTVGNLTALSVAGNINLNGNLTANTNVIASAVYTNNYRWANGTAFVSTSIANTADITGNVSSGPTGLSLTATGVTAGNYGSATSIPTVVVDSKGRVLSLTTNAVSTTITLSGTTGTGSVAGGGTLTFAGTNGVTATVSSSTITIATPQDLQTSASPTHAGLNIAGAITAATVTAGIIGNSGATLYGTLNSSSGAQTNITSVGTLTGLTVSGAIVPSTGNTVNIGSSTTWFNNIYGTAIHSLYADLAENYASDAEYAPGTVVVFGGSAEITVSSQFADVAVAGVISTNPAYLMNDGVSGLPVALRGRVPVQVVGPVTKGDLLVTSMAPGYAVSVGRSTEYPLAVFAKAIETDTTDGAKIITAVIL